MQSKMKGCDMVEFGRSIDEPGNVALNFLKHKNYQEVFLDSQKGNITQHSSLHNTKAEIKILVAFSQR